MSAQFHKIAQHVIRRRQAHEVLARGRALGPFARAAHLWSQLVTPALLASATALYLRWAFGFVDALYR
jgi:hypothetical protein